MSTLALVSVVFVLTVLFDGLALWMLWMEKH